MYAVTLAVGENLNLNVPWLLNQFLEINFTAAKGRRRLRLCGFQSRAQFTFRGDLAHAFSAASGRSFEHHRVTKPRGHLARLSKIPQRLGGTGDHRRTGIYGGAA